MKVFVGFDEREEVAYDVCKYTLEKHCPYVTVIPLKLELLRKEGLYWRTPDPLASTEFTYSRFLVPELCNYEGWALFCDCDFMWRGSVSEVFNMAEDRFSVMVVQHDYQPKEKTKMDGCLQTVYPKKNWSSMMLFNCGHPDVKKLSAFSVNTKSGAYLHQFQWTENVGSLPVDFNYLEGWNTPEQCQGDPRAVHFTRGGPWFQQYQDVEYADEWRSYLKEMKNV